MFTSTPWKRFGSLLLSIFMLGLIPLPASQAASSTTRVHKLIVDNQDRQVQAQLKALGGSLLFDYGAFSLWTTAGVDPQRLAANRSVASADEFDTIELRDARIDTRNGAPDVPARLRQSKSNDAQLWLAQFAGPIKEAWLKSLTDAGIQIVSYMPYNAYVIWADGAQLTKLEGMVGNDSQIQWMGPYHPAYRLAPALKDAKVTQNAAARVPVTVQFYNTPAVKGSLANLRALGGQVLRQPSQVLNFIDISLEVPAGELDRIAVWADVFNVEPWAAPKKLDERQGQIVAGNVTTSGSNLVPSGPGYLAWLNSKGFSTNPSDYPIVDVVDDGIDNGSTTPLHPDFYQLGNNPNAARLIYNQNCTPDATANGVGGHGNLNAGIVGAYNNLTGTPYVDSGGYRLGLGISPYGRIAGTKIFRNTGSYDIGGCGGTDAGVVAASYNAGAQMTSNSWGADAAGAYDSSSQAYDALTRDASNATPGNQQMLHIFAAGNAGSGASTVGSPGTAKNVMTVGATENVRDDGVLDGCNFAPANNANDIADFSSRGPTKDLRAKPDIVAPGTHIQGPASQDPGYDGSGVCGASGTGAAQKYYPAGQTLYTWSSGTSHSTPAVSGAASLIYNYYRRVLKPGQTSSPAMIKALMLNTPRYLNGAGSGGTLPGVGQGWGMIDLGQLFDGTPRILVDQSTLFTATGQSYKAIANVVDPSKPVRVSLVWTDAPGSTTGNSFVNDLNLQVTINGQQYKGNVFSGATSTTGGTFDSRNNVENVFLPAGTAGTLAVSVTAANLAGNGVPNAGTLTDQDFALVISNATEQSSPALSQASVTVDDSVGGNNNGIAEPGETVALSIGVANDGNATATNVQGTVAVVSGAATMGSGASAYPSIAAGSVAMNQTPYTFTVSPSQACGAPLTFSHTITAAGGITSTAQFTMPVGIGRPAPSGTTLTSTDVPKSIPDNNTAGVDSTLSTAITGQIGKITVKLSISHTFDADLKMTLISPSGTSVGLISNRGSSGDNFTNTVLDDDAAIAITSGAAPFTGTFRPEQPLSTLAGEPINGAWKLHVVDRQSLDAGTITAWSLTVYPLQYVCGTQVTATAGTPQQTRITTAFPTALQATVRDASNAPLSGVTVTFTAPDSGASGTFPGGAQSATVTTDAGGVATAPTFTANGTAGSYAVHLLVGGTPTNATFNLTNTPVMVTATGGTPQSTKLGLTFAAPFQALVRDVNGDPVPSTTVTFTAPDGGASGTFPGSVKSVTVTTNGSGVATAPAFTANNTKGSYTVNAVVGASVNPLFSLTNFGWPATITATSGTPQVTKIGTAFATPLQISVRDSDGDPVPNEIVTFRGPTTGARGTFPGNAATATATTDAAGIATAPVYTANTTPGTYVMTANVDPPLAAAGGFALTNAVDPLVILPATLPPPALKRPYNQTLTATGGTGTGYRFAIGAGSLSPGLTLSEAGVISGTPATPGTFVVTITVTDSADGVGTRQYTMIVQSAVYLPTVVR